MKYETPKLTTMTPAINAVQGTQLEKTSPPYVEDSITPPDFNEHSGGGYMDWED